MKRLLAHLKKHKFIHHDWTAAGLRRKALRDVIAILVVAGANVLVQNLGWYDRYALIDFDNLARSAQIATGLSPEISIVAIGDADYNDPTLFQGASPLNPALVSTIIEGILQGGPRVLAVDLDTSAWPKTLPRKDWKTPVPIVWSAVPDSNGNLPQTPGPLSGIPVFQPGLDGRLRTYQRGIAVDPQTPNSRIYPSFASAVVAAAGPYRAQSYGTEEQLIGFGIDYHRFRTIPASVFATRQRLDTRFYQDTVTGKIVFLGGTYRAGRDWYATPLGYEPGVEVLAHTAQTELSAPIRKLDGISSFLEDVVMSLIVLGLVFWMGAATQLIGSAVLSLSFAWLLSRFAYHSPGVFLPVCSVFGGVMVAGLVEFGMTYYELSRDHNRLLHTHRGLTNELTRLKRRLSAHALAVDSGPESDR